MRLLLLSSLAPSIYFCSLEKGELDVSPHTLPSVLFALATSKSKNLWSSELLFLIVVEAMPGDFLVQLLYFLLISYAKKSLCHLAFAIIRLFNYNIHVLGI